MSTSVPSVPQGSKEPASAPAAEPAKVPTADTPAAGPAPPPLPATPPAPASAAPAPVAPAPPRPPPAPDRPRPLTTFLVFFLLGPPIGGFIFVLAIYIADRLSRPGAVSTLDPMDIVRTVGITVPFSYVFGGLQAFAVAIYLARRRANGKPISVRRALGAALVVSLTAAPLFFVTMNNPPGVGAGPAPIDGWLFISASLGALSIASALLCALILRLRW